MHLRVNPTAEFTPFDGGRRHDERSTCTLTVNGATQRYLFLNSIVTLLSCFDGRTPTPDAIDRYCMLAPSATRSRLEALVREELVPRGILIDESEPRESREGRTEPARHSHQQYLRLTLPLFSGRFVTRIVRPLVGAFDVRVAALMISAGLVVHADYYRAAAFRADQLLSLSGPDFIALAVLTLLSALWHECGHATALVKYGGRDPGIGVGVYVVYPVFYTDVSDAWKLPRRQRACVDIGGIYFQSIFLIVLWATDVFRTIPGYRAAFLWIDLLMLRSLNPLLRMDGFWMLTDLVGSTNLRRESLHAILRIASRRPAPAKNRSSSSPLEAAFFLAYGVSTLLAFAWVYYRVSRMIAVMLPHFGERLAAIATAIGQGLIVRTTVLLGPVAWQCALMMMFTLTIVSTARAFVATVRK
jgi:putative peptide zinc metalloprotease protein